MKALGAAVIAMAAGAEGFAPAQLMRVDSSGSSVLCAMRQLPALALRAPLRTGPTLHAKVRATTQELHARRAQRRPSCE